MTGLYKAQRAMRQKRRSALQRGVLAVLDIGTSKIVCLILRVEQAAAPGDLGALAGQAGLRVIGAATTCSRGVRFGEIHSLRETESAIRTAVQMAQKMAGTRVDHVIVSFAGGRPRSYGLSGSHRLEGGVVRDADIAAVLAACEMPDIGAGRDAIHAQPVNFVIDHRTGLTDPRGQVGNTLGVDMHLLTVDTAAIEAVLHAVKRCDLELAGIAAAPYAAGLAALVEDEKELGAACIDMGGGTTSISLFLRRHMIYADVVRLGGAHVTSDIAKGLQIPMTEAEKLKTVHGGLIATSQDDREEIEIPPASGDDPHERRRITRADLIAIIRPRVEEILEEVRAILDAVGFDEMPSRRIVLTGGASQLVGIDRLASNILGQNLRLGRPMRIRGLPQSASGPSCSAAVGLALFAANPQDECWDFDLPRERATGRTLRRAIRWLRENW
ncbi:MAG: cell division protein FtsA [Alphaproteobacteria bacterium]|nr:MAG: cell division protein FtsA [Alphaproteobacteria bacterium]